MVDLPKRCRYGDKVYAVLEYERPDRFLIERAGEPAFWVRRDRIEFVRPTVRVSVAVDEALDLLGSLGVEEVAS